MVLLKHGGVIVDDSEGMVDVGNKLVSKGRMSQIMAEGCDVYGKDMSGAEQLSQLGSRGSDRRQVVHTVQDIHSMENVVVGIFRVVQEHRVNKCRNMVGSIFSSGSSSLKNMHDDVRERLLVFPQTSVIPSIDVIDNFRVVASW